jgi:hypothetical protein
MDHEYRLDGTVNDQPVLGIGRGKIDPVTGTAELDADFSQMPDGWDPRTIVLMCCIRAFTMASREVGGAVGMRRASGGRLTIGGHLKRNERDSFISDAECRVLSHVRATSDTDLRDGKRYDHSRIASGRSSLRRGENGVASIAPFDGIMLQSGPNRVSVLTRFTAQLEDGTTAFGSTTYPHYLPNQQIAVPYYQILRVESVEQELVGNHLYSRVVSSVLPLSAPLEDVVTAEAERTLAAS